MQSNIFETKEKVLRLSEVRRRTGLSRSSIYAYIAKGDFPKSISLGPRCVGWLESEVDTWIQSRIQTSRAGKNDEKTPVQADV